MPRIRYTISSHMKSYRTTYPVIVGSLVHAGVETSDIFFFVGGWSRPLERIANGYGVAMFGVDHNSIDFTGLIAILEMGDDDADFWFLLHDTCYVGSGFPRRIEVFDHSQEGIPVMSGGGMNLGAYGKALLSSAREEILSLKNCDLSEEGVHRAKHYGVEIEGRFLREYPAYCSGPPRVEGPMDFYGTGVPRIVEHFDRIDLHKLKANWSGYQPRYEYRV